MGAYGALVCLAEILKPSERCMYAEIQRESKQQEDLARIRMQDVDWTLEEDASDPW